MKTLFTTNVGSHAWSMNNKDSDIDVFTVKIASTEHFLEGTEFSGVSSHTGNSGVGQTDNVIHEIRKVIDELIKGNINFLIGTMSPIVLYQKDDYLHTLRQLVNKYCQTKACAHSIKGLATHNYKKYIIGSDTAREYSETKKCNMINRTLLFGIHVMNGDGFVFTPVTCQTPQDVVDMIQHFDESVKKSSIPEETSPMPFRNFLFQLRKKELFDML